MLHMHASTQTTSQPLTYMMAIRSARVTSLLVLRMPLVVLTCRLSAVVGREGGAAMTRSAVLSALLLLEMTGDTGSSSLSPATARRRGPADCGRADGMVDKFSR